MLWNGGISFGGVVSFIFADLIIIPIVHIYRRYYARRAAWLITWTFYVSMVAAGYAIELIFQALGLVPEGPRHANVGETSIHWNYTSVLNIIFLDPRRAPAVALLHHRRPDHVVDDGGGPDDRSVSRRIARPDAGPDLVTYPDRPRPDPSGDSHRRARPRCYPRGSENVSDVASVGLRTAFSLTHALGACV